MNLHVCLLTHWISMKGALGGENMVWGTLVVLHGMKDTCGDHVIWGMFGVYGMW